MMAHDPGARRAPARRFLRGLPGTAIAAGVALLTGCGAPRPASGDGPRDGDSVAAADRALAWVGQWRGPEGTFLEIDRAGSQYRITIVDLDGERSFRGELRRGTLTFVRDGVEESLRAGTGDDTGMKWLAGKHDCLVVKVGEGYCRD